MIVREFFGIKKDGTNLYRTYSSEGFIIQKVGTNEIYEEAIDIEGQDFIYKETEHRREIYGE